LVLDEMFPAVIATALRDKGFDVVAVQEHPELRALSDAAVFEAAQQQRRAIVTEDVGDFLPLDANAHAQGRPHFGLILTSPVSMPRHGRGFVGTLTRALESFLGDHTGDEQHSAIWWLTSAD
jgi:predicted nuclease of predicted toxin-antitoxin system